MESMNEEIECSGTPNNSDTSDYQHRRRQYRSNERRRVSNLTAEERSRRLARRAESQRQRRCGKPRSAGPSDNGGVVAREESMSRVGPGIPRGARLSSIRRLARDHCSTATENCEIMSRKLEKKQKVYPAERQVVRFRPLSKHEEDDFTLELSNTLTCEEVERRVANHLGLNYPTEIEKRNSSFMIRIRLTSHNFHADQPKYEPETRAYRSLSDMLGHNSEMPKSDILYYQVLDTPVRQSDTTMNIPFYHAARDEVSVHNIDYHSLGTVGDMLHKLKSKVQLSRPNAELRLLLIRFNVIQKIYPLSERFNNLPTTWPLRAEEVLEEERHKGPRDKMIHVCHVNTEAFAGKMNKYPYNGGNFGHPFLLVIHEEETLADIKLRLQKKFQVPDDAFFKWKSAGGKYFQDSDILYHHFEGINDWSNKGRSHFSCLCLEHSYNSWKRASAANQNNALPDNSTEIHAEVVPVIVKVEAPDAEMPNDVATIEPSKLLDIASSLLEYPLAGQLYEEPQNILDEKFEDIGGFSVLKTQSSLYKHIWLKYGHIASSHVPTSSLYSADVALVTDIMTFVMDLNNTRFSEVSPSRIDTWERKLRMAEKLEFNVKWLRHRFEYIKKVFYDEYQSMKAESARFIQVEDELKKARETISAMEIERKIYLEKENRFLFDGSL